MPILLGDNIGTTITALLASIGQSKDTRRTAVAHCIFNISGSLAFIWFVKPYAALIQRISPQGPEVEVISRQIANAHTGFNLCMTIVWTILIGLMVKIVMKIIPDGKNDRKELSDPLYLDHNLINQPAAALQLVAREVLHCSEIVSDALQNVAEVAKTEKQELIEAVRHQTESAKILSEKITDYLADLFSAGVLTEEQATHAARIMYVLSDIGRIGFLCKDLADSIADKLEKKYAFTDEAMKELEESLRQIRKMYMETTTFMSTGESDKAGEILRQKEVIMDLDILMRKSHMARVAQGKCAASLTTPFTAILHIIDRMGNSCVNIAEVVANQINFKYFLPEEEK